MTEGLVHGREHNNDVNIRHDLRTVVPPYCPVRPSGASLSFHDNAIVGEGSMVKTHLVMVLPVIVWLIISPPSAPADETRSRTEVMTVPAANIEKVEFKNFAFSDITYTGENGRADFAVTFTRTVETDDSEESEEALSQISLDVRPEDRTLIIELTSTKKNVHSLFGIIPRHRDWRIALNIKGPELTDLALDADFSHIVTVNTSGTLDIRSSSSETECRGHRGMLYAHIAANDFKAEGLEGGFAVKADFSSIDLKVTRLTRDSEIDLDFGSADLDIPVGTGAVFDVHESFGGIDLQTKGSLSVKGGYNERYILNGEGPHVDLSIDFGTITVRDTLPAPQIPGAPREPAAPDIIPSPPAFTEGAITSISVKGAHILNEGDVLGMLGIREGDHLTREQISDAVDSLKKKSPLIESTSLTITQDGELTVHVEEVDLYDFDFGLDASFNRVGGVGIGPRVTLKSIFGPFSEVMGGGEYHWANREWTFYTRGEKRLFTRNRLVLGGSYRKEYESNMDWAIPRKDAHLNAFFLGLEQNSLYEVEGGTGYIAQSLGDVIKIRAAYFDEEYRSLKKHTNWSVLNQGHTKEDNPPLDTGVGTSPGHAPAGRLTGMRYSVQYHGESPLTDTVLYLEAEKTLNGGSDAFPGYTRYLGNLVYNLILPYRNLLKLRVASGYSEDRLPDQKSFRLGGLNTLRGFSFGDVPEPQDGMDGFDFHGGGSRMLLVNADYYLFGLRDDLRLIFFGDAGNVWRTPEKVELKELKRDLGIGVFWGDPLKRTRIGDRLDDMFERIRFGDDLFTDGFRINWAIPVGNESHVSHWTVNFVQAY